MKNIITLVAIVSLGISFFKASVTFDIMTIEQRAEACNMTYEEFVLISSVVEAESNRQVPIDEEHTTRGRVLIAETILNRVADERFPSDIVSVLTQNNQFSTVRNGHSIVQRTEYSDWAVYEAVQEINAGEAPNVLFFNCRNFFNGYSQYEYVDGNYFSLG